MYFLILPSLYSLPSTPMQTSLTCHSSYRKREKKPSALILHGHVTNYHKLKLNHIKQHTFTILHPVEVLNMGLMGLKPRCYRVVLLLEVSGENPFLCLFWLLKATHISWFIATFLYLQSQKCCVFCAFFPSHLLLILFFGPLFHF